MTDVAEGRREADPATTTNERREVAADRSATPSPEARPPSRTATAGAAATPAIRATARPVLRSARRWQRRYRRFVAVSDVAVALAAALIAGVAVTATGMPSHTGWTYPVVGLIITALWIPLLALRGAYDNQILGAVGVDEFRRILNSGVHLIAVLAIVAYAVESEIARVFLFGSVALIVLVTTLSRALWRRYLHRIRSEGRALRHVLIVGTDDSVANLAVHFNRSTVAGYAVAGACIPDATGGDLAIGGDVVPVFGGPADVAWVVETNDVDVIAIADTSVLSDGALRRLAWDLSDSDVELVVAPAIADIAGPRIRVNPVAGLPLLHVDEPRFSRGRHVLKRVFDVVVAAVLIVVLTPVLVAVALAVRLTTSGPVLFKQDRGGRDGQSFPMLKFRSMRADAEMQRSALIDQKDTDGVIFKVHDDPRVTPVGRWLRRFSLDELPQLFNVIGGSMSLVGPRPHPVYEVAEYDDVVRRRLAVRPGITGLWQVNGRSDLSWDESVRLDVYYVDNWSLALDAVILLKTVNAMVRANGAY